MSSFCDDLGFHHRQFLISFVLISCVSYSAELGSKQPVLKNLCNAATRLLILILKK